MEKIKVLNLYAGIGGNRKGWEKFNDIIEVTAVEIDPEIAKVYQKQFPNDKMLVCDAHEYLLEHFKEYDFIWSSCPCVSHSRMKIQFRYKKKKDGTVYENNLPCYPDMRLYQEIILLEHWFDGLYCVENVLPYYEPMIEPQKLGRHLFWSNMEFEKVKFEKRGNFSDTKKMLLSMGFDENIFDGTSGINKLRTTRNCAEPDISEYIFKKVVDISFE